MKKAEKYVQNAIKNKLCVESHVSCARLCAPFSCIKDKTFALDSPMRSINWCVTFCVLLFARSVIALMEVIQKSTEAAVGAKASFVVFI